MDDPTKIAHFLRARFGAQARVARMTPGEWAKVYSVRQLEDRGPSLSSADLASTIEAPPV